MAEQNLLLKQFLKCAVLSIGSYKLKFTVDPIHLLFKSSKVPFQVLEGVGGLAMGAGGLIDQASCTDDKLNGQSDERNDSRGHTERFWHCEMKA